METDDCGTRISLGKRAQLREGSRRLVFVEAANRSGHLGRHALRVEGEGAIERSQCRHGTPDALKGHSVEEIVIDAPS